ncbi:MAG: c-type cytochrome [Nitrospiraceae bacterium]
MAEHQSFIKSVLKKGVYGIIVGILLIGFAKLNHFPPVFQAMFFIYAMLGAGVYILLDAPPLKPLSGIKAVIALLLFYVVVSGVYIGGASLLPQYDPAVEKGKITKLLKKKRAATELGKSEELLARAKALSDKADAIMKRLSRAGVGAVALAPGAAVTRPFKVPAGAEGDMIAAGYEQWDLQECYNCHKLYGKGGKKRGPVLDNIGNLMTPEQLKEKILYPKTWMAEGFEKQYKKKKMPDKYRDLMEDSEVDALVAFLASLKNPAVNTPKPIKKQ